MVAIVMRKMITLILKVVKFHRTPNKKINPLSRSREQGELLRPGSMSPVNAGRENDALNNVLAVDTAMLSPNSLLHVPKASPKVLYRKSVWEGVEMMPPSRLTLTQVSITVVRCQSVGNVRQCLETFLAVTTGCRSATRTSWVETRDAADHPSQHSMAPHNQE